MGKPELTAYEDAGLLGRIAYTWIQNLINKANRPAEPGADNLEEHDADILVPTKYSAHKLSEVFNASSRDVVRGKHRSLFWSLVHAHAGMLVCHALLGLAVSAVRLSSPVILRQYLKWLTSTDNQPAWHGVVWALALGSSAFLTAVVQHQQPWLGTLLGWLMRQMTIARVHEKLLRLNAAAVSSISPGFIINLVSNDVRRFDDACFFWLYSFVAPLELGMVFLMVSLELNPLAAFAGISALLALIPLQAILVQPVASIRRQTAVCTDQRVRLASEAVQGALACKMLGWEDPLAAQLKTLRRAEASHIFKMARIRATNMALQFVITVVVTFSAFAVYRAQSRTLNVASVFYAVALLQLPRRTMGSFVSSVQALTEMRVSIQRFERFLHTPEPPMPGSLTTTSSTADTLAKSAAPGLSPSPQPAQVNAVGSEAGKKDIGLQVQHGALQPSKDMNVLHSIPIGTVALTGADYDWKHPFGKASSLSDMGLGALDMHKSAKRKEENVTAPQTRTVVTIGMHANTTQVPETTTQTAPAATNSSSHVTLSRITLALRPGELLGVAGEVGSGKSSLLAALLGELQPLQEMAANTEQASATMQAAVTNSAVVQSAWEQDMISQLQCIAQGGPVITGSVAYCSQIPWIVAGSVRQNVTFGSPWDETKYKKVLRACALEPDIAALPAGDMTELGERGINLSGGQKARLALARAAYCKPDVALLDDPLSAVDPHVGRTLFNACIGPAGLLQRSTRVLITHQRQYLPLCDRILVLRDGKLVALGTWQQLESLGLPELVQPSGLELQHEGPVAAPDNETDDTTDDHLSGRPHHTSPSSNATEDQTAGPQANVKQQNAIATDMQPAEVMTADGLPGIAVPAEALQHELAPIAANATVLKEDNDVAQPVVSITMEKRHPLAWFNSLFRHDRISQAPNDEDLESAESNPEVVKAASKAAVASKEKGGKAGGIEHDTHNKAPAKKQKTGSLVVAEGRVVGQVSWWVYVQYASQMGGFQAVAIIVVVFAAQAGYVASDWWLSKWSRASPVDQRSDTWLWVYGLLAGLVVCLGFARAFLFFSSALRASTRLHDAMVERLLRAPLSFFHTNPAGRILNRFSKDQGCVDDQLPQVTFDSFQCGLLVLGALVLVSAAVPYVLPIFVPLGIAFLWIRKRYVTASREIKRWEAVTRSPVYATFSSSLKGLATIRAYGAQSRFHEELLCQLSENGSWNFVFAAVGRWIGFRLDLISACTLLCAALIAAAARKSVTPALLGLALSHLLQMTGIMQWFVRQSAEVENNMTSAERMLEYTTLEQEPPRVTEGGGKPPSNWPVTSRLTFEHVSARYRPGLPSVLKDLNFDLQPGTVCGVVGRTGSGKSSLALTLFRLIDVKEGRVMLDGVDVSRIGVDALRRQLAIIPQDPVLFSGTVRSNLDPWERYPDAQLWEVLRRVQLARCVSSMGGLAGRMAEAGDNLSVGQRQLFCLARALLQQARVLVLDEATANVDRDTDALIHDALNSFVRPHQHGDSKPAAGVVINDQEEINLQMPEQIATNLSNVERNLSMQVLKQPASSSSDDVSRSSSRSRQYTSKGVTASNMGQQLDSVLLVIAHRIDTIMDSDHLLVLGSGKLLEQGPPHQLAEQQGGVFAGMVKAARSNATISIS